MNDAKEHARMRLEDAVLFALENGFDADEVQREITYTIETAEDDSGD